MSIENAAELKDTDQIVHLNSIRLSNSISAMDALISLCKNVRIPNRKFIYEITISLFVSLSCYDMIAMVDKLKAMTESPSNQSKSKQSKKKAKDSPIDPVAVSDDMRKVLDCVHRVDISWMKPLHEMNEILSNPSSPNMLRETYRLMKRFIHISSTKLLSLVADTALYQSIYSHEHDKGTDDATLMSLATNKAMAFIQFMNHDLQVPLIKDQTDMIDSSMTYKGASNEAIHLCQELQQLIGSMMTNPDNMKSESKNDSKESNPKNNHRSGEVE